jgi:hypothetical protein
MVGFIAKFLVARPARAQASSSQNRGHKRGRVSPQKHPPHFGRAIFLARQPATLAMTLDDGDEE